MPRASDMLIVLTYAMIAIVAALAFERFGLMSTSFAWMMGAVVFLIASQAHSAAARSIERSEMMEEIEALKAANLDLTEEVAEAQSRLDTIAETIRAEAAQREETLTNEVRVLESLVRKMGGAPAQPAPVSSGDTMRGVGIDIVKDALAHNRVDLYLQPIVSLPQRKTYFYESFSRLRDRADNIITPAAFIRAAEEAGIVAEVDNLLLFRCVQIVRRLTQSDRRIGIFCNISMSSMADEEFFPNFLDYMRRNSDLASSLIFEISQPAFEARSTAAARNMARLADYGFRFSVDQMADLNTNFADMQRAGVRFAKVTGDRLINAIRNEEPIAGIEAGAILAEDIPSLFAKYGMDLIADRIEQEDTVVELLDIDIGFAQGHLFGEPRPVRDDILDETIAEPIRRSA
ncbi:EAL domain-containing protein [Hyphobacterium sp. HN65]|uniref:EAL domain-containing protein n=1 Tax=Hyphobacterium lacteum TaxID=3116575 RepID=A0ABU7LNA5_9PROT|nr:EAL domain-containing protein [Hyphobacterium sp. HN65]MEE2525373.1 EAL domain-containing protein [Hyphobacterium sp. HN65]